VAILTLPRRGAGKPPVGPRIDWSHPLAPRDGFACFLNEAGGVPVDLVDNVPLTPKGSATWADGGASLFTGDAAFYRPTPARLKLASSLCTFAFRYKPNATILTHESAGVRRQLRRRRQRAHTSRTARTKPALATSPSRSSGPAGFPPVLTATLTIGVYHTIVVVVAGSADLRVYADGDFVGQDTTPGYLDGSTAYAATSRLAVGEAWALNRWPQTVVQFGVIWPNRALSHAEVRQFTADPYAMLNGRRGQRRAVAVTSPLPGKQYGWRRARRRSYSIRPPIGSRLKG
jgi:hypothetical protein